MSFRDKLVREMLTNFHDKRLDGLISQAYHGWVFIPINMSQFVKSWEINGLFRLRSVRRDKLPSVMTHGAVRKSEFIVRTLSINWAIYY